jgi:hypothetical protein
LISYNNIARVRREVENILLLVDELDKKGVPKDLIIDAIVNGTGKDTQKDVSPNKDKQD